MIPLEKLSKYQLKTAMKRRELLDQLKPLRAEGKSIRECAAILNVKPSTLHQLETDYGSVEGLAGLAPKTENCGRAPLATMGKKTRLKAKELTIRQADNINEPDVSLALQGVADWDQCEAAVREQVHRERSSRHTLTSTLKRQARVTTEMLALHRSENCFDLNCYSQPRDLTYRDSDGNIQPLRAGDAFVFDDEHFNQGFYTECDDESDRCAKKFGVRAFRAQHLMAVDVATGRCLSSQIVARYNDAYNHRDILWFFQRVLRSYGKPRLGRFVLEHNVWEANGICEALARVGLTRWHAESAKGKSIIESRFNFHQKIMASYGMNLGRTRGEFRPPTQQWLDIRAGKLDPRKEGYLSLEKFQQKNVAVLTCMNSLGMEGRLYKGAPDEKWAQQMEGNDLEKLTARELWELSPVRAEVSIIKGHALCHVDGIDFWFYEPWFVLLGAGYRLTVCFDPAHLDAGAAILNREVGSRAHDRFVPEHGYEITDEYRRPFAPGEFIGIAHCPEHAPQFSMADGFDDSASYQRKKNHRKYAQREYHQIMVGGHGVAERSNEKVDGRGNVERIELRTNQPAEEVRQASVEAAEPVHRALSPRDIRQLGMTDEEKAADDRQLVGE